MIERLSNCKRPKGFGSESAEQEFLNRTQGWRQVDWWWMMARPMQTVKVYGVQDRRSTTQAKLPWVVRYTIDGRHRGKSFRTRIEADRYRGLLLKGGSGGRML